jgi:hypothetical protein
LPPATAFTGETGGSGGLFVAARYEVCKDTGEIVAGASGALIKPTVQTCQAEQDILFDDVTDEALEAAASDAGAASSLWSTVSVSGCTCID